MSQYRLVFKPTAVKDIKKLPISIQKQIAKKLKYYLNQPDPLKYAAKLTNFRQGGDYRYRVGQYRAVFDLIGKKITVLHIEHRREVYKRR